MIDSRPLLKPRMRSRAHSGEGGHGAQDAGECGRALKSSSSEPEAGLDWSRIESALLAMGQRGWWGSAAAGRSEGGEIAGGQGWFGPRRAA